MRIYIIMLLFDFYFREIRENLKQDVINLKKKLKNFEPGLAIVQVGDREDSNVYIRMKIKAATEIGIRAEHIRLPKSTTEYQVLFSLCCIIQKYT